MTTRTRIRRGRCSARSGAVTSPSWAREACGKRIAECTGSAMRNGTGPERAAESACRVCGGRAARLQFEKGGKRFVRCAECGFMWLEPLPSPDELEAHYAWTYAAGPYAVFAGAHDVRQLVARPRP